MSSITWRDEDSEISVQRCLTCHVPRTVEVRASKAIYDSGCLCVRGFSNVEFVERIAQQIEVASSDFPLGAAFYGGSLHDAPMYDVYRKAASLIREYAGKFPLATR